MLSGKLFSDIGLLRHAKSSNNSLKSKKADKADASGGKGEAEIIFHTVLQTPSSRVPMLVGGEARTARTQPPHQCSGSAGRLQCSFVLIRLSRYSASLPYRSTRSRRSGAQ